MKEIGGYLELDRYTGTLLHEGAAALNCGRNALCYLIRARHIRKLYLPYFCCDSVISAARKEAIDFEYYHIREDFRPDFDHELGEGEWLYIINFYGQIDKDEMSQYHKRFGSVICDNAQAYFQMPADDMDSLYTCRKFFGVADGAFLYTQDRLDNLEQDISFDRMNFVLGRFERPASDYYQESVKNNRFFSDEPIKLMSRLTENLLRGIDYQAVEQQRADNFIYLHSILGDKNKLHLKIPSGAYMYPFYCDAGEIVRKKLQEKKIYIPTLWPDVFNVCAPGTLEFDFAMNILPLPVDQRYDIDDMNYISEEVLKCID